MVASKGVKRSVVGLLLLGLAAAPVGAEPSAQALQAGDAAVPAQRHFPSAEDAVQALIEAVKAGGGGALLPLFGPDVEALTSGDEVEDSAARQRFLEAAAEGVEVEADGEDYAFLNLGKDLWPFPIPMVKDEQGWRFDTEAGLEELVNRRVGRNELHTLSVVRAIVDAQHEYARQARTGQGREFARRVLSSEGKRDGLYWPAGEGEEESPLGPLIVGAVAEGYRRREGVGPQPYHGYLFRLLTAQGSHAPGGAMSYLEGDRLTRGFAVLAYPVEYGQSGVMSFIANQRGIVYQKDLGEETAQAAAAMTAYDPDPSWDPVGEE
jgi:hypothetical protein